MTSTKFCPACGQPNQIEARFCGYCGASMPVITKREKRPFPRLLVGVLAAFLLFALAFILVSQTSFFAADPDSQAHIDSSTPDSPAEVAAADVASINGEETAVSSVIDEISVVTETVAAKATNIMAPTNTSLPKPTEIATQTPVPSPTEFLTQTPEPVYITDLQPLSLGSGANGSLDFQLPTGEVRLGGIPFQLDGGVFKSQASVVPHNLAPDRIIVETSLSMPTRVFLLLNTGNGFNRFSGQVIGEVNVSCQGIHYTVKELRLGEDVREWHSAANVVSKTKNSMQVWPENGASSLGQIDLIIIDLPEECEESNLDYIEVVDTSVETTGSMDPALNLIGVTVEQLVLVEQQDQEAKPTNYIAYVNSDGQVVIEDLNGDFSQIASTKTTRDPGSIQLKWAPYGGYLAIFRKNPYTAEIFTFPDGTLTEFETGEWVGFGWDPNVRGITYMTFSGEKWAIDLAKNLHVKYGTTITPPYEGDRLARFEPSPEMELAALNFRGGQVGFLTPPGNLYLTNDLETYEEFPLWFGNYSWSSDSRYLAGDEMDFACYFGDIKILDTQTGEIIILPKNVEMSDQFPLWSPNGRYLAIASSPKDDPQNCAENDIWIVDMDDMSRKQLTFDMVAKPISWSPDGKFLIIKTVENLLKIVDMDSGDVTDFSSGFNAQWHP